MWETIQSIGMLTALLVMYLTDKEFKKSIKSLKTGDEFYWPVNSLWLFLGIWFWPVYLVLEGPDAFKVLSSKLEDYANED